MKKISIMLLLFLSIYTYGQEHSQGFENAFEQAGEKVSSFINNYWESDQTETQLVKELENGLEPLFQKAFENQLKKRGKSAKQQSGKTSFSSDIFTIGTVQDTVGNYLAQKVKPLIPGLYKTALDSLIYNYRGSMSIEQGIKKASSSAAKTMMSKYKEIVLTYINNKKSAWSTVKTEVKKTEVKKTELEKAQEAYEDNERELLLYHIENAILSKEMNTEVDAHSLAKNITTLYSNKAKFLEGYQEANTLLDNYWKNTDKANLCLELAQQALYAGYYADAGDLANEASKQGASINQVNGLKYSIYDTYYQKVKKSDKSLAKRLKKERKKYKDWK